MPSAGVLVLASASVGWACMAGGDGGRGGQSVRQIDRSAGGNMSTCWRLGAAVHVHVRTYVTWMRLTTPPPPHRATAAAAAAAPDNLSKNVGRSPGRSRRRGRPGAPCCSPVPNRDFPPSSLLPVAWCCAAVSDPPGSCCLAPGGRARYPVLQSGGGEPIHAWFGRSVAVVARLGARPGRGYAAAAFGSVRLGLRWLCGCIRTLENLSRPRQAASQPPSPFGRDERRRPLVVHYRSTPR